MDEEVTGILRRGGAAHITFASGRRIILPSAMLEELPVSRGTRADPEELCRLAAGKAPAYCLRQVMLWQSRRDHAEGEMKERLLRMGYPGDAADGALDRLRSCGAVSDRRYCESLVRRKKRSRGRGALLREMRARGVDEDTALAALEEEMDEEEETGNAVRLALGLLRRGKDRDRVFSALLRRGYPRGICMRALERALAEREEDP